MNEVVQLSRTAKPVATHTYIVLVNWNGWQDTLECVESLLKMNASDFSILICDNRSTDGSYERIKLWAEEKAISRKMERSDDARLFLAEWHPSIPVEEMPAARLILIQAGSNLGFAGGCNVGLRYGLARGDGAYFWLLNNDTIVTPGALSAQVQKMEGQSELGIVGSTLLFYDEPGIVQCCAGYGFNTWTARVRAAAENTRADDLPEEASVESRMRYVSGASMFVRRQFLEQVGLLNEQYFLYFEEIDWTTRAGSRFNLGYCSASKIMHKEGRSIGSARDRERRSLFSEHWLSRNRILFTRTYFPLHLPVTLMWTSAVALSRLLGGSPAQAWTVFAGAWSGLFAPSKSPETFSPSKGRDPWS